MRTFCDSTALTTCLATSSRHFSYCLRCCSPSRSMRLFSCSNIRSRSTNAFCTWLMPCGRQIKHKIKRVLRAVRLSRKRYIDLFLKNSFIIYLCWFFFSCVFSVYRSKSCIYNLLANKIRGVNSSFIKIEDPLRITIISY